MRNFDQIQAGDTLRVDYHAAVAAMLLPAKEETMPAQVAAVAAQARKGEHTAVGVGFSLRIRIESIDRPRDIVVFSLDSGDLIAHRILDDEGCRFARRLKVGDFVQLDYDATVALSIEKIAIGG